MPEQTNFVLVGEPDEDVDDLSKGEEKVLRLISKLSVREKRRIHDLLGVMLKNTIEPTQD